MLLNLSEIVRGSRVQQKSFLLTTCLYWPFGDEASDYGGGFGPTCRVILAYAVHSLAAARRSWPWSQLILTASLLSHH